MADQIQEIIEEIDIEDHTWSDDDDASLHLDDIGIFDCVDVCDYDEALNPMIVSANSFNNSEDQRAVKQSGHRRDDSTGILSSTVGAYPASCGYDSGSTRVSDFEESPNPEVEESSMASVLPVPHSPTTSTGPLRLDNNELVKATFPPDSHPKLPYHNSSCWRTVVAPSHELEDFEEALCFEREDVMMAPVTPAPYSPTTLTGALRLDDNELVKATFPPDSHPQLPYHDSTWWYDNTGGTVVPPGPEEDEEAVPPQPPLNHRRAKPPRVVFKKRLVAPLPPPPPEQAIITPPRPTKRKRAPKIRAPRKKEPKTKQYVTKTSLDVLLGRGGCSNHHSGNSGYRERILELQPVYKRLERHEKTQFSQDVVDWVKHRGGRFLKRDGKASPWYVATDQMARTKVSQALREDHSAAGKHAKKEKQARASKRF